jgi:MFS family permease
MASLFRNRFVVTILMSGLMVQIGMWVRNFSVLLFVVDKTHGNAFAVSMISVAEFAPIFLFSFIGGTFADRWRPKRTMVICDALSALSIMVVLLVLSYGSWRVVFVATLASSILSQFSQPSGMRLFKLHVPESLMQAGMSIYQTEFAVFMILGPMLGTFVYQHYGIKVAIAITGLSFFLSAAILTLLPKEERMKQTQEKSTVLKDMKLGLQYVLDRKILTLLGGAFLAAGLGLGLINPLGVFFVTERLGLSKDMLQWFTAANGLAMIIGGVLVMGFSKRIPPQRLLMLGMAVNVAVFVCFGFATNLWLSLGAQFFSGLFMPGLQIGINTMILENSEGDFVGRVSGTLNPMFMGGMVLTMMFAGWLKQLTSLSFMYTSAGVLFFIGVLILMPIFGMKMKAKAPVEMDLT